MKNKLLVTEHQYIFKYIDNCYLEKYGIWITLLFFSKILQKEEITYTFEKYEENERNKRNSKK